MNILCNQRWGALVIGLLMTLSANAEIYKSTDAEGNTVFSQEPPPGQPAEIVTPQYSKQPDGASGASAVAPPAAVTSAAPPAAAPEKMTAEQIALKGQNCTNAHNQLTQMNSPRVNRMQYTNENNELVFLTEDMRQQRIADAEAAIKEYCD